ncbi:MAG TPA: hypothetical protein DCS12_07085 [Clostridiales bacterium]|nr:hypothetical protein [Clostridiales bacterium]
MKRLFFGMLFVFLVWGLFAQSATQSIVITGTVPQILNIVTESSVTTFDLNELGATVLLPSVTFKSNLKSWVIKVYSENASNLKNDDNDLISYTFTLGTLFSNISLLSTEPNFGESGYKLMSGKTAKTGTLQSMAITYSGDGGTFWSYDAGSFIDTITLKVAVN